ncbi:MAG: hypothetical protein IJ039_04550 [Clostridia bacterium]|nr:hypothetical protein [Clostridia bacterium]
MVNFSSRNGASRAGAEKEEYAEKYVKQKFNVQRIIDNVSSDKFALGLALKELWLSGDYSYSFLTKGIFNIYIGTSANKNLSSKAFFAVCEFDFGLDKSAVSRLINVVDEFCDEQGHIKDEYKKFKYSVLCEMLPLNQAQREKISCDWTVSQVRDYKKHLIATMQEESSDLGVIIEKPVDKYAQFKDWKRADLCKRVVDLEIENRDIKAELEKLKKAKKTAKKK